MQIPGGLQCRLVKHRAAEHLLLLLDVDLLADFHQVTSGARQALSEAVPVWAMPKPAPIVLDGATVLPRLETPPCLCLDPSLPVSIRIKDAAAYAMPPGLRLPVLPAHGS